MVSVVTTLLEEQSRRHDTGDPRWRIPFRPDHGHELMDDILAARNRLQGLSIILIEHEMGVISRVSDRCVVLNFGRKICEGGFQAVVSDRGVQEAYLGTDEAA